jgi:hypothetical protein
MSHLGINCSFVVKERELIPIMARVSVSVFVGKGGLVKQRGGFITVHEVAIDTLAHLELWWVEDFEAYKVARGRK